MINSIFDLIKKGLSILCLTFVAVILIKLYLISSIMQKDYIEITNGLKKSIIEWTEYSSQLNQLLKSQKTQESLGLLLRSGKNLDRATLKVNNFIDQLTLLMKRTDSNLNEKLFPQVLETIQNTEESIVTIPNKLDAPAEAIVRVFETMDSNTKLIGQETVIALAETTIAIKETEKAVQSIDKQINNPSIGHSISNIEEITESGSKSMDAIYRKLVSTKNFVYRLFREIGFGVWRIFTMK